MHTRRPYGNLFGIQRQLPSISPPPQRRSTSTHLRSPTSDEEEGHNKMANLSLPFGPSLFVPSSLTPSWDFGPLNKEPPDTIKVAPDKRRVEKKDNMIVDLVSDSETEDDEITVAPPRTNGMKRDVKHEMKEESDGEEIVVAPPPPAMKRKTIELDEEKGDVKRMKVDEDPFGSPEPAIDVKMKLDERKELESRNVRTRAPFLEDDDTSDTEAGDDKTDDDDDDEDDDELDPRMAAYAQASPQRSPARPAISVARLGGGSGGANGISDAEKQKQEAQRAMSERLRREALEKKSRSTPSSVSGKGGADVLSLGSSSRASPPPAPKQDETKQTTFGKLAGIASNQFAELRRPAASTFGSIFQRPPQPPKPDSSAPRLETDANAAKAAAEAAKERERRIRAENSRRREEKMQTDMRAQAEAAKKAEKEAREAEERKAREKRERERNIREAKQREGREEQDRKLWQQQRQQEAAAKREAEEVKRQAQLRKEMEEKRLQRMREEQETAKKAKDAEIAAKARVKRAEEARKRQEGDVMMQQTVKDALTASLSRGRDEQDTAATDENEFGQSLLDEIRMATADDASPAVPAVTSPAPAPVPAQEQLDAEALRRQRIQAMRERNARMHDDVAAAADDDDVYQVPRGQEDLERQRQARMQAVRDNNAAFRQKEERKEALQAAKSGAKDLDRMQMERVKAMEKRDARNGDVFAPLPALSSTTDLMDLDTVAEQDNTAVRSMEPEVPTKSGGPISLKAWGEQNVDDGRLDGDGAAQSGAAGPTASTSDDKFSFDNAYHMRHYGRKLGDVRPEDIKLFQLKASGVSNLPGEYLALTGISRGRESLRARARQIKETLMNLDRERGLLKRVADGEEAAVTRLNELIRAKLPEEGRQQLKRVEHGKTGSCKTLGSVTAEDIMLIRWKSSGLTSQELLPKYEAAFGQRRSFSELHNRHNVVKSAITRPDIDEELLDRVVAGDEDAQDRLNIIVQSPKPRAAPAPSKSSTAAVHKPSNNVKQYSGEHLGEITAADVKVMYWRESGMDWPVVVAEFEQATGVKRSSDTLRRRLRHLQAALETTSVDNDTLPRVAADDLSAREELNRTVYGVWPVPTYEKVPWERPRGPGGAFAKAPEQSPFRFKLNDTHKSPQRSFVAPRAYSPENSSESSVTFGRTSSSDEEYRVLWRGEDRPTTGGKTVGPALLSYMLESAAQAYEKEPATEETQAEDDGDEEDRLHFVYQVQRREVSKAELDESLDVNEMPWLDVDNACFYDIGSASAEVNRQACKSKYPDTMAALVRSGIMQRETDELGLLSATHSTKDGRAVQVRVERRQLAPSSTVPDLEAVSVPKRLFYVCERTTVTTTSSETEHVENEDAESQLPQHEEKSANEDESAKNKELFGEEPEGHETQKPRSKPLAKVVTQNVEKTVNERVILEKEIFSTLEQANTAAIGYFVKHVVHPSTGHHDRDGVAWSNWRRQFAETLEEEGDGAMFSEGVPDNGRGVEVDVWVERGLLKGPRNM